MASSAVLIIVDLPIASMHAFMTPAGLGPREGADLIMRPEKWCPEIYY